MPVDLAPKQKLSTRIKLGDQRTLLYPCILIIPHGLYSQPLSILSHDESIPTCTSLELFLDAIRYDTKWNILVTRVRTIPMVRVVRASVETLYLVAEKAECDASNWKEIKSTKLEVK